MTARQLWLNLGIGIVGSVIAALLQARWWLAIGAGALCFVIAWAVESPAVRRAFKRKAKAAPSEQDIRRLLVVDSDTGNIATSGDEGSLDARVAFLNEFPDRVRLTATRGVLIGVGPGAPMELAVVPFEVDVEPRGARPTVEAQVHRNVGFTLNATQARRIREAVGLTANQTGTKNATWTLSIIGRASLPSGLVDWERAPSVHFTITETPSA